MGAWCFLFSFFMVNSDIGSLFFINYALISFSETKLSEMSISELRPQDPACAYVLTSDQHICTHGH